MKLLFAMALAASSLPLFADLIPYSGSEYTYTVQHTGVYQLTASGAQGGNETSNGTAGGAGAIVTADFALTAGEMLNIYVGGQPVTAYRFGAGGGGTFVVVNGSPLLVAGGGGGASPAGGESAGAGGVNASLTPGGTYDGSGQDAGGTGGYAASGKGGGAGFYTLCPPSNNQGCGYATSADAFSGGGSIGTDGTNGGFGGGGGSGDNVFIGSFFSGGGGGYSGGGNGAAFEGGGGGGSYVDSSALFSSFTSTFNSGNGQLEIDPVTAPEPASLTLLGLGLTFIAIPGVRRMRRSA